MSDESNGGFLRLGDYPRRDPRIATLLSESGRFAIHGETGPLLTLHPDLSVEYGPNYSPEAVEGVIEQAKPSTRWQLCLLWRLIQEVERLRGITPP